MSKIIVEGSEATVTVLDIDEAAGVYGLECSQGIYCPRYQEMVEYRSTNVSDVILTADVHSDVVSHL